MLIFICDVEITYCIEYISWTILHSTLTLLRNKFKTFISQESPNWFHMWSDYYLMGQKMGSDQLHRHKAEGVFKMSYNNHTHSAREPSKKQQTKKGDLDDAREITAV